MSSGTPSAGRPAATSGTHPFADPRVIWVGVIAVMFVWAANFVVVKDVISILPPVGFTLMRYTLSSFGLLALLRWSEGEIRFPRPDGWRIVLLGGVGFGVYQILWTVGLVSIPAGDSALLIASTPVFVAVMAVLIGTDTLSPRRAVGVVLSFVGVVIIVAAGIGIELTGSPVGFALTLLAAVCWAMYTAVGARFLRRRGPLEITTWATVGGTLVLAPIGLAQLAALGAVGPTQLSAMPQIVFAVAYSGLLAAGLANIIIFAGVRLMGPTRVTTLQSLVPAMAVVLAFIFLGEPIHPGQIIGGVVILAGVALTREVPRRSHARSEPPARTESGAGA